MTLSSANITQHQMIGWSVIQNTQEMKETGHGIIWNTILAFVSMSQGKLLQACQDIHTLKWSMLVPRTYWIWNRKAAHSNDMFSPSHFAHGKTPRPRWMGGLKSVPKRQPCQYSKPIHLAHVSHIIIEVFLIIKSQ